MLKRWPDASRKRLRTELAEIEHVTYLPPGQGGTPEHLYDPRDALVAAERSRPPRGLWCRKRMTRRLGLSQRSLWRWSQEGMPRTLWCGQAWHDPAACARWLQTQPQPARQEIGRQLTARLTELERR